MRRPRLAIPGLALATGLSLGVAALGASSALAGPEDGTTVVSAGSGPTAATATAGTTTATTRPRATTRTAVLRTAPTAMKVTAVAPRTTTTTTGTRTTTTRTTVRSAPVVVAAHPAPARAAATPRTTQPRPATTARVATAAQPASTRRTAAANRPAPAARTAAQQRPAVVSAHGRSAEARARSLPPQASTKAAAARTRASARPGEHRLFVSMDHNRAVLAAQVAPGRHVSVRQQLALMRTLPGTADVVRVVDLAAAIPASGRAWAQGHPAAAGPGDTRATRPGANADAAVQALALQDLGTSTAASGTGVLLGGVFAISAVLFVHDRRRPAVVPRRAL